EYNLDKSEQLAQRHFRIGAATDIPQSDGTKTYANTCITNAVRLQEAARPGEFLIDEETFMSLPPNLRYEYGEEETVQGKHEGETFRARRCVMAPRPKPAPQSTPVAHKPPARPLHNPAPSTQSEDQ